MRLTPSEPAPSPTGVTVRVTWVENGSTLPGPQDWLVLSALAGSGVCEGAEVEFVRSRARCPRRSAG